ncbi:MAG: hypothetical protein CMJ18_00170 [Phycisphaeraceae bacterium]|nr:hypothetical protein [Phycisphaeraceae bacterium]
MRVGLAMIYHESNTLVDQPITLESFRKDTLCYGEAVRDAFAGSHHEAGGFFEGLADDGIEAVPLLAARIIPGGVVTADAIEALLSDLIARVHAAGPLDGLLVAPHGASVSEVDRDMDGHWLGALRRHVGPDLPIVSTLDAHASLSRTMVEATDAITVYRTNPHLDQFERGLEAADLIARTLRGEVRPAQAACMPPLVINIERQATAHPPLSDLCARVDAVRREPGVLSASMVLGFQWADVPEMGTSFIVVTDGNPDLAQTHADALGDALWDDRDRFVAELIGIDEAIDEASRDEARVLLLDMGDNIGCASPGDGTLIAHALRRRAAEAGPGFVCLADRVAVQEAASAGIGETIRLAMGGRTDDRHGPPLVADVQVVSLHDGRFSEDLKLHSGFTEYDMGPSAVVRAGEGMTILLTSRPTMPFSLKQLTSCGIDPESFRVIVAKGVQAPVAAYAPVCDRFIRVNTPGVTTVDLDRLDLVHRRRPMFPFETDFEWSAARGLS